MTAKLNGKLVLITGASTGIGAASARAFVRRGARVIGVARSREKLESLSVELGGPERFLPLAADVTDAASMKAMTSEVLERIGIPDVVMANAGVGLDALFVEMKEEVLQTVLDVNVLGLLRTVRPFCPA